uniref:Uncharacterized protein n=1 Tax=Solanum tuberosum TaxID=4113 RepID=M1D4X4_SOLTU
MVTDNWQTKYKRCLKADLVCTHLQREHIGNIKLIKEETFLRKHMRFLYDKCNMLLKNHLCTKMMLAALGCQ